MLDHQPYFGFVALQEQDLCFTKRKFLSVANYLLVAHVGSILGSTSADRDTKKFHGSIYLSGAGNREDFYLARMTSKFTDRASRALSMFSFCRMNKIFNPRLCTSYYANARCKLSYANVMRFKVKKER